MVRGPHGLEAVLEGSFPCKIPSSSQTYPSLFPSCISFKAGSPWTTMEERDRKRDGGGGGWIKEQTAYASDQTGRENSCQIHSPRLVAL